MAIKLYVGESSLSSWPLLKAVHQVHGDKKSSVTISKELVGTVIIKSIAVRRVSPKPERTL
jgi:hypothetical protein